MSDTSERDAARGPDEAPNDEPSATGQPEGGTTPVPAKKKRRWRRRIVVGLVVLLGLAVLFRVALSVAFPVVLKKVAAGYGLDADYERFTLSLTGGDVGLGRVRFTPHGSAEPFATAGYVRATISPLKLFVGKLEVWRVEADGVTVNVDREADGRMPVIDRLLASAGAPAAKPAATPVGDGKPGQIDLTSPLQVEGFRLQAMTARIRDKSLSPPLDATVRMDVRVDDVGSAERPTRFEVAVYSDPVLDSLIVTGEGRAAGATLDANITAAVKGLHLKPLAGYLELLGLRPVADSLMMRMDGRVRTTAAGLATAARGLASVAAAATMPGTKPAAPQYVGGKPADAVACDVTFRNMSILADGREAAAVDSLTIDATKVSAAGAALAAVLVDGVRASAERTEEGNLRAVGLELFPVAAKPPATRPAVASASLPTTAPAGPVAKPFTASLDRLAITNVSATVADRFVDPPAKLAFHVDELTVHDLVLDPAKADARIRIAAAFRAPGVAESFKLTGTARPFAAKKSVELTFAADGVAPRLAKPYLDLVGLESRLENASFTATLAASAAVDERTGTISADARLGQVSFRDRQELFALNDVNFAGVSLDPRTGLLKVGAIEVSGPSLGLRRDPDGALAALGFRTKPPVPGRQRKLPPHEPSDVKLARVELGRFSWKDVKLTLEDQAADPPETVALADAGVEVTDLTLDLVGNDVKPTPGKVRAWLSAPRVADQMELSGTVTPAPGTLALDLTAAGRGITAVGVKGYLRSFGIEPTLTDGSFSAHAAATLAQTDKGLTASLRLDRVKYADGHVELAGVDKLTVDAVELDGRANTLTVGSVEVERPRASVLREKDGTFAAGGIRLLATATTTVQAPAPGASTPASAPPLSQPRPEARVPSAGPSTGPATAPTGPEAPAMALVLKTLRVKDAALDWTDRSTTRPVDTTAHVDVDLTGVTLGRESVPAELKLALRADDIVDKLTVTGNFSPGQTAQSATLTITASGVRGSALEPYLPPGTRLALKDGRLTTKIDAGLEPAPEGGLKGRLLVDGVDWRDGADGPPLLKLKQFRVTAPRVDVPGNVVTVDEVALDGLELDAVKRKDGAVQVLGLALGAAPPAPTAEAVGPAVSPSVPPAAPTIAPATQPAPSSVPADANAIVARARKVLPLVTLNKLDLNVSRIGYRDLSAPDAQPLAVTDLRLRNVDPVRVLGPDPANGPAARFELTGRAGPLVDAIDVKATVAPFAQQPSLQADVLLAGIKGDGLFALAPGLKSQIDGSALTAGQFKTRAEVQLKVDRRGPTDVDLSKGFDAEVVVRGTEYRAAPDGPVLLGLDELRVEEARVRPAAGTVRVKSVELSKPTARALRDRDGIHALGLLIKAPAPATQPAADAPVVATPAAPEPVAARTPASGPAVAQKPAGEIRIDKLVVTGVDVRVEDRSVDPPVLVPITSLDVEARDLSSLAQYEDRPIRFTMSANAGKVTLPKKLRGGVLGAAGDVAKLLGGQQVTAKPEFEDREMFAQIAASGRLALYPKPSGWAKANVSGFEVASIAGLAKQSNVELSHGTFDVPVDVRAPGDGTVEINARPSFTDLNVSEPPNGLIVRYLQLPAPLDVVIGAMEAADKSITVPVAGVKVQPSAGGTYSLTGVADQILPVITSVIVKAVAAAPVKAVTGVADAIGVGALLGTNKEAKPEEPIVLLFPAGATDPEPAEARKLAALADRLKADPELQVAVKHELGGGDLKLAEARANPTPADAAAMAAALRRRKLELGRVRADVAAEARVRLASGGGPDAAAGVDRLRAIDREIGRSEEALDRLYDLLRPGADRQAPRRTRAAALDVGRDRLEVVRQSFAAAGVPNLAERVKPANPQFNPTDDPAAGGRVTITLAKVKK